MLVVLERWAGDVSTDKFPKPEVTGTDGEGRWYDSPQKFFRLLIWRDDRRPPLDCVEGTLDLNGSTAFGPAVRAAAEDFPRRCEGVGLSVPLGDGVFKGSTKGVTALDQAGEDGEVEVGKGLGTHLTFTDGLTSKGHPRLVPHSIAISVFSLVVNKAAGVENLYQDQIRDVFAGQVTNWEQVGGNNVPVHLINRGPGSGTRSTLVTKVLKGEEPPRCTVTDCASLNPDRYGRCEDDDTDVLLNQAASMRGAISYSETAKVDGHKDAGRFVKLKIDGKEPTAEGVEDTDYPYWQTEYAYTYGEAPAGSPAAAFLNFLTQQGGGDMLHQHSHGLCSEAQNSAECRPI